jgi:hypothetical protein
MWNPRVSEASFVPAPLFWNPDVVSEGASCARAQVQSAFHLLRNAAIGRKICGEFGDFMDDFLL